jgi:HAD superfamily hydrolase (TIGR01509 family)
MIRAVIFDMDGVLTDSSPIHAWAFQETLRPYGIEVYYPRIAGMRTLDVIQMLLAEHGVHDADAVALGARKSELALQRMREENPVVPGALDVVERLAARYPVALASSGSRESIETFLELNAAQSLFQVVLTGSDVHAAKPSPDIYLEAARRLGFPPAECLVVEDAEAGAQAARAAGCPVTMVTADASSLATVLRYGSREQWTAIIPAAGRGSRLGFDRPKILYPVAGRTILDWLGELLSPFCERLIVVASPDGAPVIAEQVPEHCEVVVQREPLGMADAIRAALPRLETKQALIVWGDQAALKPESIEQCIRLHESAAPLATVPTAMRPNPYIHFERDSSGRVVRVLQAREGDAMPAQGESDSGVFFFRSIALRRLIGELERSGEGVGARTGEFNFLPILPLAARIEGSLLTPRIMSEEESIGVNTPGDAERLAEVLRARHV